MGKYRQSPRNKVRHWSSGIGLLLFTMVVGPVWFMGLLATHFFFYTETRFTNQTDRPVYVTAISSGNIYWVTRKNGIFPFNPNHAYNAIYLRPGQTAMFQWDWDDSMIHGFRIEGVRERPAYLQTTPNSTGCCEPSQHREYILTNHTQLTPVPPEIESIKAFTRLDRWISYLTENCVQFLVFTPLFILFVFLFGETFVPEYRWFARRYDALD